ncbi:MAG: orotidine-5'-phosphate decarboxylase [Candidatus Baltobacteraceae bacterium]|jgi:orotidine-5'-phosphate decarboxylase
MNVAAQAKLIVALDVDEFTVAASLVERLAGLGVIFKVGLEPLLNYGEAILAKLAAAGAASFIDAKLHDIPRTVGAAARALVRPGVRIVTVHALGGREMMRAAVDESAERARELGLEPPQVFAVTLLTSIAPGELSELGLQGDLGENVLRLARLARDARCAGVVCSPHEVRDLKRSFGAGFAALCPGIRPAGAGHGDQKRVATPRAAVEAGADYLVVGRPVTEAADPLAAASEILAQMASADAR